VFEGTNRAWDAALVPGDDLLAPDGRVMEALSEHLCQGWLEGYDLMRLEPDTEHPHGLSDRDFDARRVMEMS
jgi:phosphoketolase